MTWQGFIQEAYTLETTYQIHQLSLVTQVGVLEDSRVSIQTECSDMASSSRILRALESGHTASEICD